jgi:hypothetical protein
MITTGYPALAMVAASARPSASGGAALVVATVSAADAADVVGWLRRQRQGVRVVTCFGFHAAVPALSQPSEVLVAVLPPYQPSDDWRLAELRSRAPRASIVAVADPTLLPGLVGALRADLGVTRVDDLPPLREMLLTGPVRLDERPDQTNRRRSNR